MHLPLEQIKSLAQAATPVLPALWTPTFTEAFQSATARVDWELVGVLADSDTTASIAPGSRG
jgi:hypothetical protein